MRVTNINHGGAVGAQVGDEDDGERDDRDATGDEVTNINRGGTVGIQAGRISGAAVVVWPRGGQ